MTTTTANATSRFTKGPDAKGWYWATGRRKCATARVCVRPGSGEFTVNDRPLDEYFASETDRKAILAVLEKGGQRGKLDVRVRASGGGVTGHAGAVVMGLGRAISGYDASLERTMRESGYLTRDAREVERKKPGQPGARRRFQFSKR